MFNPFSLEGKTILVTGASSGIGRGIAVTCSKMGAKVVVNGRNKERLQQTFDMLDGEGHVQIQADFSTQEGIDKIVSESPILNGFVNSAGIPQICPVKNITRNSLLEILIANTVGPIVLTSLLLKKKIIQKKSSIVYIASMSGVCIANTGEAPYGTSKAALAGFIKTAAYELAGQGTRVNTICPGLVPTNILKLSNSIFTEEQLKDTMYGRYPLKRVGTTDDIANGAVYLLSDASSWVTGQNLVIDGGYTLA